MSLLLHIETATKNCSVSLSDGDKLLHVKEFNDDRFSHGELLHVFIEELFTLSNMKMDDLKAVSVSMGPGSYTGLRIGVAAAKGFCFSLDIPLIGLSTLAILARSVSVEEHSFIIPLLDARRLEVYSAVYNHNYACIREIKAEIINEHSFSDYLAKGKVYFLGDGAQKCSTLIQHENAIFMNGYYPSSKQMPVLADKAYQYENFENIAYFEPLYLKEFLVTPSKKKLL
ncbi:tRNA (adenosine(37)-N6)-threonylcarbamoyltransferase complex dimerization subunit type 1 TsaB [Flavobacteriaceae bacterium F08102]|nr:tRNA (adenosine(37)-N6)-threonylcarbamoyltransferase complex dimerization subunit type 1 TsaB [Flavobacteriaceae bacterium F08102]